MSLVYSSKEILEIYAKLTKQDIELVEKDISKFKEIYNKLDSKYKDGCCKLTNENTSLKLSIISSPINSIIVEIKSEAKYKDLEKIVELLKEIKN